MVVGELSRVGTGISRAEWLAVVARNAALVRSSAQTFENPFERGESMTVVPSAVEVDVVVDGAIVGGMAPAVDFDESGVIEITGDRPPAPQLRAVVEWAARELGATVEWD